MHGLRALAAIMLATFSQRQLFSRLLPARRDDMTRKVHL